MFCEDYLLQFCGFLAYVREYVETGGELREKMSKGICVDTVKTKDIILYKEWKERYAAAFAKPNCRLRKKMQKVVATTDAQVLTAFVTVFVNYHII